MKYSDFFMSEDIYLMKILSISFEEFQKESSKEFKSLRIEKINIFLNSYSVRMFKQLQCKCTAPRESFFYRELN